MSFWTAYGLPDPIPEYRFHPIRRWRFDFAWPTSKVAVEIDGGLWTQGRHSRAFGMMADNEKINEAQKMGWRVFRFTPTEYKKGIVQSFLLDLWKNPTA